MARRAEEERLSRLNNGIQADWNLRLKAEWELKTDNIIVKNVV